jgi:hypothetical protein
MAKSERFEMRVSAETLERIDVVRGGVSRAAWIGEAIERRLAGAPFPVVAENLAETPAGEVVKVDREKPASYVQKRPAAPKPDVPYELPKIAKRKW